MGAIQREGVPDLRETEHMVGRRWKKNRSNGICIRVNLSVVRASSNEFDVAGHFCRGFDNGYVRPFQGPRIAEQRHEAPRIRRHAPQVHIADGFEPQIHNTFHAKRHKLPDIGGQRLDGNQLRIELGFKAELRAQQNRPQQNHRSVHFQKE